jgi:hypothetical protein
LRQQATNSRAGEDFLDFADGCDFKNSKDFERLENFEYRTSRVSRQLKRHAIVRPTVATGLPRAHAAPMRETSTER